MKNGSNKKCPHSMDDIKFTHGFYVCQICGVSSNEFGLKEKNYRGNRDLNSTKIIKTKKKNGRPFDHTNRNKDQLKKNYNQIFKGFLEFRKIDNENVLNLLKIYSDLAFDKVDLKSRNKPKPLFMYLLFRIHRSLARLKLADYIFLKDIQIMYENYLLSKGIGDFTKRNKNLVKFLEEIKIDNGV